VYIERSPTSPLLDAKSHGRSDVIMLIVKMVLIALLTYGLWTGPEWLLVVISFLAAVVWIWLFATMVPFASLSMNAAQVGMGTALLWANIAAVIAWASVGTVDVGLIVLLGTPLAGMLGFTATKLHFQNAINAKDPYSIRNLWMLVLWTRERLRATANIRRRLDTTSPSTGVETASSVILDLTRWGVSPESAASSDPAMALEELAVTGIEAIEDMFPSSGIGHTVASSCYAVTSQRSHFKERQALTMARATSKAFDIEFFFFQALQTLQTGDSNKKDYTNRTMSIVDRVLFDQHKLTSLEQVAECYKVHLQLMKHIATREMDIGYLQFELGSRLDEAMRTANGAFDAMLRLNADSPEALNMAADYYLELAGNSIKAAEFMQRAQRIEEHNRRVKERKVRHFVFGSQADDDLSPTDEQVCQLTISTERTRLGEIVSTNAAAVRVFGNSSLVGSNINVIIPRPISDIHDSFLAKFVQTGTSNFLDSTRLLLAQHSAGYLIPVRFRLFETPPSVEDMRPKLTGLVAPVATEEGFLIIGDDTMGFCIMSLCIKTLGLLERSVEAFTANDVQAALIFPELFGTAGQGGVVDSAMPVNPMLLKSESHASFREAPEHRPKTPRKSVTEASSAAVAGGYGHGPNLEWLTTLPPLLQKALRETIRVTFCVPEFLTDEEFDGSDRDSDEDMSIEFDADDHVSPRQRKGPHVEHMARVTEVEEDSDHDSTGAVSDASDSVHLTGAPTGEDAAKATTGGRVQPRTVDVSLRVYPLPKHTPTALSGLVISWSISERRNAIAPMSLNPASIHSPTVDTLAPPRKKKKTTTTRKSVQLVSPSQGHILGQGSQADMEMDLPSRNDSDEAVSSPREEGGRGEEDQKQLAIASHSSDSDDGAPFGINDITSPSHAKGRGNTHIESLLAAASPTESKPDPITTAVTVHPGHATMTVRGATTGLAMATTAAPSIVTGPSFAQEEDDARTTASSAQAAVRRSLKRALEVMTRKPPMGVTIMRRAMCGTALAFIVLASLTLGALGPWATTIRLHATALLHTSELMEDVHMMTDHVNTMVTNNAVRQQVYAEGWPVTDLATTAAQLAVFPEQLKAEAQVLLSDAIALGGVSLTLLTTPGTTTVYVDAASIGDGGAGSLPNSQPITRRSLAEEHHGVPVAMRLYDAVLTFQSSLEAIGKRDPYQLVETDPDVAFVLNNAHSIGNALNGTLVAKFVAMQQQVDMIEQIELYTFAAVLGLTVVVQVILSICASRHLWREQVALLGIFYHTPSALATAMSSRAEAKLRKQLRFTSTLTGDDDVHGDSDDSAERQRDEGEEIRWQLMVQKMSRVAQQEYVDAESRKHGVSTEQFLRSRVSRASIPLNFVEGASQGGRRGSIESITSFGGAPEKRSRQVRREQKDLKLKMKLRDEEKRGVAVTDSRCTRTILVLFTMAPSILIAVWFAIIFSLEIVGHKAAMLETERVVHMQQLNIWSQELAQTIAEAVFLPEFANNVTALTESEDSFHAKASQMEIRMRAVAFGGLTELTKQVAGLTSKQLEPLPALSFDSSVFPRFHVDACPSAVEGAAGTLLARNGLVTLPKCRVQHAGILSDGMMMAVNQQLSRYRAIVPTLLREGQQRVNLTRATSDPAWAAANSINVTSLRANNAALRAALIESSTSMLQLAQPWMHSVFGAVQTDMVNALAKKIDASWEAQRTITIVCLFLFGFAMVFIFAPRLAWLQRVVMSTRRMLLVIPDDVLLGFPRLAEAVKELESALIGNTSISSSMRVRSGKMKDTAPESGGEPLHDGAVRSPVPPSMVDLEVKSSNSRRWARRQTETEGESGSDNSLAGSHAILIANSRDLDISTRLSQLAPGEDSSGDDPSRRVTPPNSDRKPYPRDNVTENPVPDEFA
jgi:hypothetical protein